MKIPACFLFIVFSIVTAAGQSGHSESTSFTPRKDERSEKKSKKKDANKKKSDVVQPQAPTATDKKKVETVTIPISVRDRSGAPVTDLSSSEVSVFVEGSNVPVRSFEKSSDPPAVVLVLDTSPSTGQEMKSLRVHAQQFVDTLPPSAKVVVVEFDSELKVRCQITDDRAALRKCIAKADMGDGTSLYSAMRTLFEKVLPLVPGPKTIVMFTDGVDTTSRASSYTDSINWVERSDIPIFTVYYDTFQTPRVSDDWLRTVLQTLPPVAIGGSGNSANEYETGRDYLTDLAAATGGRVIKTKDFDDEIKKLSGEIQARYYATIEVPGAAASRPLKVRVNRPNLIVRARGSIVSK